MVFSSVLFLFCFFVAAFLGYYLIRDNLKNYWLLAASVLFYAWGEPKNVVVILLLIAVNFGLSLLIDRQEDGRRKLALTAAVVLNLAVLTYYIYSAFFARILLDVTGIDLTKSVLVCQAGMPVGVSFVVFQILSYQIDLYRKNITVQKNVLKLALYIMLFPQLIAGPIVRYSNVAQALDRREITLERTYAGLKRFMIGFAKKVLLSNTVAVVADYAYGNIGVSGALSWLGALCYMLQIYYDFSGYSDMALGMGEMAGFTFAENFNFPYASKTMQEFWRRWHISLSSWFRDYLYIPLGGNRKGKVRTYVNLLIVFFLTGLWHGASFNFIVWGLFHGFFLCLERLGGKKILEKLPPVVGRLYTLLVVLFGWIFFRANTLGDAFAVIGTMLNPSLWNWSKVLPAATAESVVFLALALLFMFGIPRKIRDLFSGRLEPVKDVCIVGVFALAVLFAVGSDFSPFIYFQF